MITSVEISDKLWDRAWSHRPPKATKRALIEEALRVYVRLHEQAADVKQLRGKLVWDGKVNDLRE